MQVTINITDTKMMNLIVAKLRNKLKKKNQQSSHDHYLFQVCKAETP